jgi:hypothetical protein
VPVRVKTCNGLISPVWSAIVDSDWGMIRGMIRLHVVILLLTVVCLPSRCHCQDSQDRVGLASILGVMSRAHLSGSLGYCNLPVNTTPVGPTTPPLQALREMLADNKDMRVMQDPDGTIRMLEKTVPQDLLNVKIGHISFDEEQKKKPNSMYFDILAMDFITGTPEVKTFMRDQGISFGPKVINRAMSPHPSVSGELNDVTLAQALDYMLKTFRGLWIYEECPGTIGSKRIVNFFFYGTE